MAIIKYKNVKISAVAACVPPKIVSNFDLGYLIPPEEIEKTVNSIGIKERRIAEKDVCASDLCFKAAEKLFEDTGIDRNSIDMVLFISQMPDYRIPATAPLLQKRLNLPKTTAALDLSLGCSGYVYALSTAFAYASMEGINRVLLLDGETFSKIVNRMDKVDAPLYGDAGTATLIEKGGGLESFFSLYSDGNGENAVKIKAGGARSQTTAENMIEHKEDDGSIHSDNEVYMDGMDVFNFALSVVPKSIKEICNVANIDLMNVDNLVLHQANKFMTDFFVKKLKYPTERVPYCLQRFGNTSSASIPLTISTCMNGNINNKKIIMCGFGAGLSWGTVLTTLSDCYVSNVFNY